MPQNATIPLESSAAVQPSTRKRRSRAAINDLDLKKWKEYGDILTDSLWMFDERDRSGSHTGDYHGNFVPQIPNQVMRRFTRKGDVVLDPFLGSGTTLIEARKLGRHGIGVELQEAVGAMARERIRDTENSLETRSKVIIGDSTSYRARMKVQNSLMGFGREKLQMIIAHPPYHDIIRFSDREGDLSNAPDLESFNRMFGQVLDNFLPLLEKGRYFVLVIGDKYAGGEWIPLGFELMRETLERGLILKSLIVKNMTGNRAKRNLENLWRYRALYGGFYIFKHEYVMIFRKKK